jgi:creatinine amidohydrolase
MDPSEVFMRLMVAFALMVATTGGTALERPQTPPKPESPARGTRLEDLAWPDAEKLLQPDAIVVVPLGAAAKEHGPHLKLRNDLTLADYLTRRVISVWPVAVAPTLTYHFYPGFLEYPGSTSLTQATARDLTADVVRSLARFGPKRFYVLNTGISTVAALAATAKVLAAEGILLHYTDFKARTDEAVRSIQQQRGGTHADEIETSMMLYIDPSVVDMSKAVSDYTPAPPGPLRLTRRRNGTGTYSATGIWGDPTLATPGKGRVVVEALVRGILGDLEILSKTAVPQATEPIAPASPVRIESSPAGTRFAAAGCSAGDERTIRAIGPAFSLAWTNHDAEGIARLWSGEGDIVHPDGSVERTAEVIRQNRAYLFRLPEHKASRHFLGIGNIRCLTNDVAVADGKWDLRELSDANRKTIPPLDGLCTLVLKRANANWLIEAYRYTITPRSGPPPTVLKQPGFVDR